MIQELLSLPSVYTRLKESGLPVYLYGTGDGADKILDDLRENGITVSGVFASAGFVRERTFRGFPVESIEEIERREGRIAAVLCFGLEGEEAFSFLKPIAEKHLLVSPSLPVYGEGKPDHEMVARRAQEIEQVYEWLADDLSKDLYLRVLKYCLTGEISHLEYPGESNRPPEGYFAHTAYHLDVGAYDGDTALEYLQGNPACGRILAFEPNPQTFRKLVRNVDPARVECILAACSAKDGSASQSGSGRGSRLELGEGEVAVRSLDSVCGYPYIQSAGLPVGSLKIDAEGEDLPVLQGAANLITACRPAMCVSAYHRAEDLVDLPLVMKRLDYRSKLYFRKKPYVPAWDTAFYLIPHKEATL